jgi:hypothetical protein
MGQGWSPCDPPGQAFCDVNGTGTCVELPGEGGNCEQFGLCKDGFTCVVPEDRVTGRESPPDLSGATCLPLRRDGESCSFGGGCVEGLFCAVEPFHTLGACRPLLDDGAECRANEFCQSGFCDGLFQGPGGVGTCAALPGLGEPCDGRCAAGLACDFSSGMPVCSETGGENQACNPEATRLEDQCDAGLRCNGQRCVRPAGEGEDCAATGGLCAEGLACQGAGVCGAPPPLICETN